MEEKSWILRCRIACAGCSPAEKRAADYIVEQKMQIGGMTLRECAAGARCGQPTVIRFLKRCGSDGKAPASWTALPGLS